MNIFRALQVCNDISRLYMYKDKIPFIPWNYSQFYQIRVQNVGTIIEAHRCEGHLSPTEFVPVNFWTNLFNTAGNHATVPLTFTVIFNNNGMLPHAPMQQDLRIHGLSARLIYNRMRKEHLNDWHKTIELQKQERRA